MPTPARPIMVWLGSSTSVPPVVVEPLELVKPRLYSAPTAIPRVKNQLKPARAAIERLVSLVSTSAVPSPPLFVPRCFADHVAIVQYDHPRGKRKIYCSSTKRGGPPESHHRVRAVPTDGRSAGFRDILHPIRKSGDERSHVGADGRSLWRTRRGDHQKRRPRRVALQLRDRRVATVAAFATACCP